MLPDVDADDGDVRQERVLIGGGGDLDLLGGRVQALQERESQIAPIGAQRKTGTYEPAPAGALDARGGGVELLLEVLEGAEDGGDSLLERAVLEDTAVALALRGRGREVGPEERVVNVACGREMG